MAAVLQLVTNAASLTSAETFIRNHVAGTHTVTPRTYTDTVSTVGFDLVLVAGSSTTTATWTSNTYAGENKPIVCLARHAWPALGYATGGTAVGATGVVTLQPRDASHPTHAGYPVDTLQTLLTSSTNQWRSPTGAPASATRRWSASGSENSIIFTFEPSAALLDSKTAQQREVAFGLNNFDEAAGLTSAGLNVIDAMIAWALGGSGGGGSQLATPTGFTFTTAAGPALNGAWSSVSGAATYDFQVDRWTGSTWTAFASGNTASTSFTETSGVAYSTQYRSRVRAVPA
jgi:hypothetical protein